MKLIKNTKHRISLYSANQVPLASSYLWNARMMVHINCQGYANGQFLQPEPTSYASGPVLEATTFMQPEQPVYANHPGRFFYVKDEQNGQLFSLPFAPTKAPLDSFEFQITDNCIGWRIKNKGLSFNLDMFLDQTEVAEVWQLVIRNDSARARKLSLYPYFSIGYRSWMNQSADFDDALLAIISEIVTPYQKIEEYYKQRDFNELTFLLAETEPTAWETRQQEFEGEHGLHAPAGIKRTLLAKGDAHYEAPCAAMQYRLELAPGESKSLRFAFGAAANKKQIVSLRSRLFSSGEHAVNANSRDNSQDNNNHLTFRQTTPDHSLDCFVNLWLPRQITYHNDLHRLCTDPQTRNFLQDSMGLVYLNPKQAQQNLLLALSQQNTDGSMPDGILLHPDAKLKYINQIPHTDHPVWLAITIHCYLRETNDLKFLNQSVNVNDEQASSEDVYTRVCAAMDFLGSARDQRGLSYIQQGDWCDPMNMVGHKGKGVSTWLTLATAYAAALWSDVCSRHGDCDMQSKYSDLAQQCNDAANKHAWDENWYARGITDDGKLFGVASDDEGKIFLNPQSWALLSKATNSEQKARLLASVHSHLHGPWGVELLSPAYTSMREDIGRVTQKFPGTAENGSVYNHASCFYAYALYENREAQVAFDVLKQMLPNTDEKDIKARGQLANFIPNYYRGAHRQFPRTAGRSSQLIHTGTIHWYLRCLIDGLFGLRAEFDQLALDPQLPLSWPSAIVERRFLGADFVVSIRREELASDTTITVDGEVLKKPIISNIIAGKRYAVEVILPITTR